MRSEQKSSVELETLFEHGVRRNDTSTINDRAQRMDHEAIDSVMPSQPYFALYAIAIMEILRSVRSQNQRENKTTNL